MQESKNVKVDVGERKVALKKQAGRFCGTFNNPPVITAQEAAEYIYTLIDNVSEISTPAYLIRGKEVAKTGTPHWQIYFELESGKRIRREQLFAIKGVH